MVRHIARALALLGLLALLPGPSARASNVRLWVTPATLAPNTHAAVVVHLRGVPAGIVVGVTVTVPFGQRYGPGYVLAQKRVRASLAGSIDLPLTLAITDPGLYPVNVVLGTGAHYIGEVSAGIPVPAPVSTSCGGGPPIPHVFTRQHEVLVEGTVAKLGSSVGLLGIGYPPCRPVSLAEAVLGADFIVTKTGKHTDRYGTFRVRMKITLCPGCQRPTEYEVYPIVDAVLGPTVLIGIASP
jgi:hypothetical protein